MDLRLDFADIIIKHLRKSDRSQKELAEIAGITEPAISRLVHADANCTLDTVARVLFALGVKAEIAESDRVVGTSAFDDRSWRSTEYGTDGEEEEEYQGTDEEKDEGATDSPGWFHSEDTGPLGWIGPQGATGEGAAAVKIRRPNRQAVYVG